LVTAAVVIFIPLWNKNLKNRVSSEFVAEDVKEAYEKKWWLCCRKVCPSQLFIPLKKYSSIFCSG